MAYIIDIDPASPVPLYRQISGEIRRLIAVGVLKPGDRLPTVRELAARIRVNRNTAARAIQQLESDGVVSTRVGKGTFVSEVVGRADRPELEREIDSSIDRLLVEAHMAGMSLQELQARLKRRSAGFEGRGKEEK
jgi:GntR family transcriptional regulator